MDSILKDIRYALRGLFRSPGFSAIAILTLALGVAASTVVFGFGRALLSARVPVRDIDRVVGLWLSSRDQPQALASMADLTDWRRQQESFEGIAGQRTGALNLSGADEAVRVRAAFVTADYFVVTGNLPVHGRGFRPEEYESGATPVAVLSDRFWRERFEGQADTIGRGIRLDGRPATIVGVLPPDDLSPDVIVPLAIDPRSPAYEERAVLILARLKTGITVDQARAEMQAVDAAIARDRDDTRRAWSVTVMPYRDQVLGRANGLAIALLGFAACAVLLIGCANVANLLLARGIGRAREFALRTALGASRRRLVGQLLTEAFLLAFAGTCAALILARWGLSSLRAALALPGPLTAVMERAVIDVRVVGFALALCATATACFGLLPALKTTRADVASDLNGGGRTGQGRHTHRLRAVLVTAQVGVAVLLLVVVVMFTRSLAALQQIEPGFETANLLTMNVSLPENRYATNADTTAFFDRALVRLRSSPGVIAAGAGLRAPVTGSAFNATRTVVIEGRVAASDETFSVSDVTVTPGYLETLRIPLLAGRMFASGDGASSPLTVVINQTMARRYWETTSPIGSRIRLGDEVPADAWRTIVGVVADIRNDDVDAPPLPMVYVPMAQRPGREMTLILRTTGDPMTYVASARAAVAAIDADQPIYNVRSMDQILSEDLRGPAVFTTLGGIFGAVALALAAIGIYGVVAFTVAQRTREIGVRVAVGAARSDVFRLVIWQALTPTAFGLGFGLAAASVLSQGLAGLLYGVTPTDPSTYAVVIIVLLGVALVACFVPARRAMRIDPLVALRADCRS